METNQPATMRDGTTLYADVYRPDGPRPSGGDGSVVGNLDLASAQQGDFSGIDVPAVGGR